MKEKLYPYCYPMLTIVVLLSILLTAPGYLFGQELRRIEIPSSFNPVGSGARAMGMGGAFMAQVDDATAASWNPGGLFQLVNPRVSMALATFRREEDNSFGTNPEASGLQPVSSGNFNYAGIVYPIEFIRPRMVLAVTYQYLYDLHRSWRFPIHVDSETVQADQIFDSEQKGGLSALGLSYSIQLTTRLGLGLTLNVWDTGFNPSGWKEKTRQVWNGTMDGDRFDLITEISHKYEFSGYNANFGILWEVVESKLKIGAVFKSPFKAELYRETRTMSDLRFPDAPDADVVNSNSEWADETLEMPMSYGVGFSYQIKPHILANLDIYRTEWSDFVKEDEQGNRVSPISGKLVGGSDVTATHQIRLGGQYYWTRHGKGRNYLDIPFRVGLFYDPAPADGNPDDYYGFSLGSGLWICKNGNTFGFDFAFQYRFGRDVSHSIFENLDFSQDVDEHTFFLSAIWFYEPPPESADSDPNRLNHN